MPSSQASSYKFKSALEPSSISSIALPIGVYWNMDDSRNIVGIYIDSKINQSDIKEIGLEIQQQIKAARPRLTPSYIKKAQDDYWERKKKDEAFMEQYKAKKKAYYLKRKAEKQLAQLQDNI